MTSLLNNAVGWHGGQALAVRLMACLALGTYGPVAQFALKLNQVWHKQLAERSHLKEVNKVMCEGPE